MDLDLTVEQYAQIIKTLGPLSQEELREMPDYEVEQYFSQMVAQIKRRGLDGYVKELDLLGRATRAQIVGNPEY